LLDQLQHAQALDRAEQHRPILGRQASAQLGSASA
jgi:hypothetical protein